MSQLITATFEDGVLKPHETLDLEAGARVHVLISPYGPPAVMGKTPWRSWIGSAKPIQSMPAASD